MTRRMFVAGALALAAALTVSDPAGGGTSVATGRAGMAPRPASVYDLIVLSPKEGTFRREENYLVHFRSDAPKKVVRRVTVTGLVPGEQWLYSIALRPKTKELYALGRSWRLYKIDAFTGAVTWTGPVMADVLQAMSSYFYSIAFDPAADVLRVVSAGAANFRVDPDTGEVIDGDSVTSGVQGDPWLTFATDDRYAHAIYAGAAGIAYDREGSGVTLYGMFGVPLGRIGPAGGSWASADANVVHTIADMPVGGGAGIPVGFTITDERVAFMVFRGESGSYLANVDLTTGDWSPGYTLVDGFWMTGAEIGYDDFLDGNGYHALCLSPVQTTPPVAAPAPQPDPSPAPGVDEPPPVPPGPPPSIVSVVVDVDLATPGRDDVTIKGILPVDESLEAGQTVVVTAGDAVREFTLDAARRGRDGAAVVRFGRARHGRVRFHVRMAPEDLADELDDAARPDASEPLPVALTLDGKIHSTDVPLKVSKRGRNHRIGRGRRR